MFVGKELLALEGNVCAGKTSIAAGLSTYGFARVSEYIDYAVGKNIKFPQFPPINETEAKANFEFYLGLDKLRRRGLKGDRLVFDRSQYTLLAFEAGARVLTQIDIFDWACNLVSEMRNELVEFNHVVYIDIPLAESKKRANLAGMNIPAFLHSSEFTLGFRQAFDVFKTQSPERFTFVDGYQSYTKVLGEVRRIISSR